MAPGKTAPPPPQKYIQVMIDPDLLNCSICCHPLCSPVNECDNGHVACPSCWFKLKHKCHICNAPVVSCSIALGKILELVHIPCTYANFGCREYVSYSQRQVHTDTCEFAPSLCPIPGCAHKASSGEWRAHFIKDHQDTILEFRHHNYGESCEILFNVEDFEEDRYDTFFGPGKDVFMLVKEALPNVGKVLTLYYIDLPDLGRNYVKCKLRVQGGPYLSSSLQSESRVVSIKDWNRGEVHGSSLVLQSQFVFGDMSVDVLLNKKEWSSR